MSPERPGAGGGAVRAHGRREDGGGSGGGAPLGGADHLVRLHAALSRLPGAHQPARRGGAGGGAPRAGSRAGRPERVERGPLRGARVAAGGRGRRGPRLGAAGGRDRVVPARRPGSARGGGGTRSRRCAHAWRRGHAWRGRRRCTQSSPLSTRRPRPPSIRATRAGWSGPWRWSRAAPAGVWSGRDDLWRPAYRHPTLVVGLVMDREHPVRARQPQSEGDGGRRGAGRGPALSRAAGRGECRRPLRRLAARGRCAEWSRPSASGSCPRTSMGTCTLEEAIERMSAATRRYVRRQCTWMRRLQDAVIIDVSARTPADVADEVVRRARAQRSGGS